MEIEGLGKYSNKLINFINNSNLNLKKNNFSVHPAIIALQDIISNTGAIDLTETAKHDIKPKNFQKIYENKPLMFVLYEMILSNNPELIPDIYQTRAENMSDLYSFANYFNSNQMAIVDKLTNLYSNKKIKEDIRDIIHFMLFQDEATYIGILHRLLYKNGFVALDIQHYAEKYDITHYFYTGKNVSLHIFLPINNRNINLKLVTRIINIIRTISKTPNTHTYLNIFFSKQFKYTPTIKNAVISPSNINSGSSQGNEGIDIWRSEEYIKVLIHELIHYFNLDYNTNNALYSQLTTVRNAFITVDGRDSVHETYTELLALTIHTLITSQYLRLPFDTLFNYEIIFSLFQTAKIINHFNNTELDAFDALTQRKIIFKQSTNVCSYFIVKTLFLFHYSKLLDFWQESKFIYCVNETNYKQYVMLYSDIFKDSFAKPINKTLEYFINIIQKFDSNLNALTNKNKRFIERTLRMTCLEL
jgi:hypothetical protein